MTKPKAKGLALVIGIGRPGGTAGGGMGDAQRRQHAADVEAAFTGRPQPHGTYDNSQDGGRVSEQTAGYMELDGAAKDGDCDLVGVDGGISGDRGCCNLFEPRPGADAFACGKCAHLESDGAQPGLAGPQPVEVAA